MTTTIEHDPRVGFQTRDIQIRSVSAETREVQGIGVPFGEIYERWGFRETFNPACEFRDIDTAKVLYLHREPIGRITRSERTASGMDITGTISRTATGEDAYTLLRDGVIDSFSIGFEPIEFVTREDGTVEHTVVRVREFSVTPTPAYLDAKVSAVRHDDPSTPVTTNERHNPVTDTITREDVETMFQTRDEALARDLFARLAASAPPTTAGPQYRTMGDYLKAVAEGEDAAVTFHRDYTGGVLADTAPQNAWLPDAIRQVDKPRRTINMFGRGTLPEKGLKLEYYQLKPGTDTTAVGEQVNEGDDLTGPGKIEFETETADIKVFGGWIELSRKDIQRATVPVLNTTYKALQMKYANQTEAYVRGKFLALLAAQKVAGNKLSTAITLPNLKSADWLDLIVDGALAYEDRGFTIDGLAVSADIFKTLYRLEDGAGHNLMNVYGTGVNVTGSINAKGPEGNIANIPVKLLRGAPARTATFFDPVAMTTLESAGAPFQLQDENIINLTKQFSLWGEISVTEEFPTALLPLDIPAGV
ncbi:HK97 family phage prohead protease [Microbacteriaceae bacterium VKM Ac-2854]|nr:HK97 family phage prohead protease [Microbacteriaceae bacterium VKM Ac-2854]